MSAEEYTEAPRSLTIFQCDRSVEVGEEDDLRIFLQRLRIRHGCVQVYSGLIVLDSLSDNKSDKCGQSCSNTIDRRRIENRKGKAWKKWSAIDAEWCGADLGSATSDLPP